MSRAALTWTVLCAGVALLVFWQTRGGCAERTDDPLVRALLDRCGTSLRLERELKAQPASASVTRLLANLTDRAERVDHAGAGWEALEIEQLLEPEDHAARESLTRALETIWHPEYEDEIVDKRVNAATGIGLIPNPYRTSALLRVLEEKREPLSLRRTVVEALESSRDPEVVAALEEHWYADTTRFQIARGAPAPVGASLAMRRKTLEKLKRDHTPAATEALLNALEDPDVELRASAAFALRGREGPGITDALVALISPDEHYTVVYMALAAIDGCPSYPFLRALLATYEGAVDTRVLVVPALARCDDARVVGPIVESLDQRTSSLGLAAANALATLAHRNHRTAVIPLQKALARDAIETADKAEIRRALDAF